MLKLMKESGSLAGGYRWKEHKIKILRISPEILGMLCLQSAAYKVTSGLPVDARCLGMHIDVQSGDILLKIESEEYEPVEQGTVVPYLDAKILVIERLAEGLDMDLDLFKKWIANGHAASDISVPYDTDRDISSIIDKPCIDNQGE